jgi:hypothetical protein
VLEATRQEPREMESDSERRQREEGDRKARERFAVEAKEKLGGAMGGPGLRFGPNAGGRLGNYDDLVIDLARADDPRVQVREYAEKLARVIGADEAGAFRMLEDDVNERLKARERERRAERAKIGTVPGGTRMHKVDVYNLTGEGDKLVGSFELSGGKIRTNPPDSPYLRRMLSLPVAGRDGEAVWSDEDPEHLQRLLPAGRGCEVPGRRGRKNRSSFRGQGVGERVATPAPGRRGPGP